MNNRLAALFVAIAITGLVSCKKDKAKDPVPEAPARMLSSIEENDFRVAAFTYNSDGTIKEIHTSTSPGNTTTFTFTYNAEKKPVEFVSDEGYKSRYVYLNGTLDRTENFENGKKVSESVFTYENGKIKSNTLFTGFPQHDGSVLYRPTFRTVYTYHTNGWLMKTSAYVLSQPGGSLELDHEYVYYTYDDKKNPLFVISEFSQIMLHQPVQANNPLIERRLNAQGAIEETTMYSYTYDAAGYPLTARASTAVQTGDPLIINTKFNY
ncbi:MAG TPA: hypothetical protein VD996_17045 [Chitinophagaceae bacterium]|nr:hypothetical protein [Chitinophagaceae bacterium]